MKLMVIGGGGREHAIIRALKKSPRVDTIYALPGNAGMEGDAILVPIGAKDIPAQVDFAKSHGIDFAVVAPDDPLVLGAVDALTEAGIPCFGPRQNAAMIEGSKVFAKDLMARHHIPTARCRVFSNLAEALSYAETAPLPQVIKADGLALGKGVIIAETREAAKKALHEMMEDKIFGESGAQVVMEEFLTGPEVSVLAFTDGKTIRPMVSSMDHKRAHDGDTGPNTGGMGTVAPNPYYTPEIAKTCMDTIFRPTIDAMAKEGRPFAGCLYFGLMLTAQGPKVIEYNCRFGDPETQVVLPLLKTDLFTILEACAKGTLDQVDVAFSDDHACCVILASQGYPGRYEKGYPITLPAEPEDGCIYIAGAARKGDQLVTNGGRVLGAVAVAKTLPQAVERAYALADSIHFENADCRRDIGQRALAAGKEP